MRGRGAVRSAEIAPRTSQSEGAGRESVPARTCPATIPHRTRSVSKLSPPKSNPPSTIGRPPGAAKASSRLPRIDRDAASIELRLAITKGGLGLELARTAQIACLSVTELAVSLPGMRFPLDVSGGVSRFRHRRGQLLRVAVEIGARAVERWAAPRLVGILGPNAPEVSMTLRPSGCTVALSDNADGERSQPRILVFDLAIDARDDDLRISVARARGAGLVTPATALAVAAAHAMFGAVSTREGARFVVGDAAARLARALLPDAGARAPSAEKIRWTAIGADAEAFVLQATRDGVETESSEEATRAHEAAALTREGDDARFAGNWARARALDVAALERAPRHPEICRRIVEIDQLAGGRAEAALATLAEAEQGAGPLSFGPIAAELHAEAGDRDAAIAGFARVGDTEAASELAARAYERAAELVDDPHDALVWLDLAVTRAPAVARLRWARAFRRLSAGRIEEALGDVEHLEAIALGAQMKFDVWRRAGDAWRAAALRSDAGSLYERALRYVPDDPAAIAGLGAALVAEGRAPRGAALLARAIDLSEARGESTSATVLELARALGDHMNDRPAAIARARTIRHDTREALVARGLEGRWREELGDVAGASLAYARLRDHADAPPPESRDRARTHADTAGPLLLSAARFELDVRRDALAAQRHLAAALRLCPHAPDIARAYREVCAKLAGPGAPKPTLERAIPSEEATYAEPRHAPVAPVAVAIELPDEEFDEARASVRVEDLARQLQSNPNDDSIVDELSTLLMRLGRGHELLALLSARLEDASPERRVQLIPIQRDVLERLE